MREIGFLHKPVSIYAHRAASGTHPMKLRAAMAVKEGRNLETRQSLRQRVTTIAPASPVLTARGACLVHRRRPRRSSSLSASSSSMFGTARNALQLSRLRFYSALIPIAAAQRPRNVSTVSFDPTIRQFLVKLAEHQPCFSMHSSSVSIMHEPRIFYQTLLVRTNALYGRAGYSGVVSARLWYGMQNIDCFSPHSISDMKTSNL